MSETARLRFLCGENGNKKNKNIFSKNVSFGKYLAY